MLRRLFTWLRPRSPKPLTAEHAAALAEAERIRQEVVTSRVVDRFGPRGAASDRDFEV